MRLALHFQPRRLLGLFSMVTAMTVVSTSAQAEPPPPSASQCGNGYCDEWADEDATTCPADCACPADCVAPGSSISPTAPDAVPMKTHSRALINGGIVLIAAGALSLIGGATATAIGLQEGMGWTGFGYVLIVGTPLFAHGLGCVAGGIPMIVVGAKKIQVTSALQRESMQPSVRVGPTSATLTWAF